MVERVQLDGAEVVQPGDRIGRYFVLERLGQGGMGVVVLAHDPKLDRKVAIKLLHPKARRKYEARKRLLREAQAMASLSHPNVIGVHDVGVWGDHVFVAMEYVDGITLGTYAAQRPPMAELLAAYVAAGRGLAAAHRADLVHRDFKPDNVMIAEDGRVLVLDFGLARAAHSGVYSPSEESDQDVGNPLESLTAAGEVMGTPMYMAPEQHIGEATAASDQYSFCVALYEALTGERPFTASDLHGLAAEKVRFALRPLPARSQLPRRVHAALRRGLHPDPHQRFPTMDDLLVALERGRRFDPIAIASLCALACVGALGVFALPGADPEPCAVAASAVVLWDDERREAVQDALVATAAPYAVETTHTVLEELDTRVERLASARHEACAATHVARTQPPSVLDLRMACLDRRTDELAALVGVLEQADRDVIEHAVAAARNLQPAAACNDVQGDALPRDPLARAQLRRVRAALASAAARVDAGKYEDALADLDRLLQHDDHPPLRALIQLHRGEALQKLSEFERAKAAYLTAADLATQTGDDRTAARAHSAAAWTIGHSMGRPEEARNHLRSAQALVERLGAPPDLHVQVLLTSGVIAHDEGAFDDALRDLESVRALQEEGGGPTPSVLADHARVLHALGRTEDAEAMLRDAVAIAERTQGVGHPQVGKVLAHLGALLLETGRIEDARAAHQRELDIFSAALPEDHMLVAFALSNVAGAEMYLQRYDTARERMERSRGILRLRLGPEHPNVGRVTMNIGEMWRMAGDLDRALAEYEAALATLSASLGTEHPDTARCRNNVASVLHDSGRFEDAGREYALAFESLAAALGDEHPSLAYPLTGVGQTLVERGAAEDAIEPLERALALRNGDDIDPFDLGDTKLALARALWDSGRDRRRAVELGRGAREAYAAAGHDRAEAREHAEAWLAEHGDPGRGS